MSYLYVSEQGSTISINANRFEVKCKDGMLRSIPAETLEMIEVFGKIQMTTQCMEECLKRGISVIFFSTGGAYYGRLISTNHVNVARQRKQAALSEDFCAVLARNIVQAKIHNQVVVLRRYARTTGIDVEDAVSMMQILSGKIDSCTCTDQIMGFEGAAARRYFEALGRLIVPEFRFSGRNRRPPRDPFNSLISLGYSVILNEIYGKLEGKGLNPYFGVLHKDREKHPTLASDLMEEWRAVIADSLAMSLLNGHELQSEHFCKGEDGDDGVYLTRDGFKVFIAKIEKKFIADSRYLSYIDYAVSFRRAMDLQVNQFCRAIEEDDPLLYKPVRIR